MAEGAGLCRVCLRPEAQISLFQGVSLGPQLAVIASLQIAADDSLPQSICSMCSSRLIDAFSLRNQAQTSDAVLRERFPVKIELLPIVKCDEDAWKNGSNNSTCFVQQLTNDDSNGIHNNDDIYIPIKTESDQEYQPDDLEKKTKPKNIVSREDFTVGKVKKKITKTSLKRKKKTKRINSDVIKEEVYSNDEDDVKLKELKVEMENLENLDCEGVFSDGSLFLKSDGVVSVKNGKKGITKGVKKQICCEVCSQVFKHRHSFTKHMRLEHKEESFKRPKEHMCDMCGNTFHDQYGLRMHKRSHSGDRPYTCNICGQGFSQQSNMERHISARHLKDKPFQCELCPKRFAYSSTLREHSRNHSGERRHACEACGRRFSRRFALARHQLTHTRARPYSCRLCPRDYTQTNDLKAHVRRTHPEQPVDKLADYCIKQIKD